MRVELGKLNREPADVGRVDQRLAQWKSFYGKQDSANSSTNTPSADGFIKTSFSSAEAPPEHYAQAFPVPNFAPRVSPHLEPTKVEPGVEIPTPLAAKATDSVGEGTPRMVLVDVVLVSTQELINTSKGINLLSALTLQLGSVAGNVAAYSKVNTSNSVNNAAASVSTAITRAVTIPALAYSLNIATPTTV